MKFLIVAGDPSGDLLASKLAVELKKQNPTARIDALGGAHLELVADRFITNIVKRHALGFAISLRTITAFRRILNEVLSPYFRDEKPDAVVLVDFYGFNSRVARMAKGAGIKVYYYVCPQFWASRSGRAEKMRSHIDLFLCVFPFELEFFKQRNMAAQFVGHPIIDELPVASGEETPKRVESLVGLLPGSRPEEIRRHLPVMVRSCRLLSERFPGTRYVLFTVPHVHRDIYLDLIEKTPKRKFFIEMIRDEHFEWRAQLDAAITASGMETLENALLGIPMVVMYKTDWITYFVAKSLIQISYLAMPNLLANRGLVPEFIQQRATAPFIYEAMSKLLGDSKERLEMRRELLNLRAKFGRGGASARAAAAILENVNL